MKYKVRFLGLDVHADTIFVPTKNWNEVGAPPSPRFCFLRLGWETMKLTVVASYPDRLPMSARVPILALGKSARMGHPILCIDARSEVFLKLHVGCA
jgi:hypothetical protein